MKIQNIKKHILLVDLDNIYIINNIANHRTLLSRLATITNTWKTIPKRYYGNMFTKTFVKEHAPDLKIISTAIQKDSADHRIINTTNKLITKYDYIHILSNDMILAKLAYFVVSDPNKLVFHGFKNNKIILHDVAGYCFKSKLDLTKFIDSYNLYRSRVSTGKY